MNRFSPRVSAAAAIAAFSVLFLSLSASSAVGVQIGKNGVIHSCFKAKGKNKGALRVVPGKRSCRKLRGGWRPLSWSVSSSSPITPALPPGPAGREGKEGPQGPAGQVDKSLIETVKTQATEIEGLTSEVTDLTNELLSLKGTVGETCSQLTTVTEQSDKILSSLLGSTVAVLGNLLNVPSPPSPLGAFECE